MILILVHLFVFLFLIFVAIYLPGFLLLSKLKDHLDYDEQISLSFCLGIVSFVMLGSLLGIINLRFLLLPIILITSGVAFIKFRLRIFNPWKFLKNKFLLGLILLGILIQGFISFPSGYHYKEGLLFWSSQAFDGFWHIAIMEELKNSFPPQMPVFAGTNLVNYHYLSDILMGEFARIFPFFKSLDLYFRFFPIFFSFLMGTCVFAFVKRWQNLKVAYWSVFFTYFCGSFGYIVIFLRNGQIFGGETVFWAAQLNSVVANPPHAVAISLLLSFLLSFFIFLQNRKKEWFFITTFIALIISGFKVSAGVVLLSGLITSAAIDLLVNHKKSIFYLFLVLLISNFVTIKLMTKGVESYLIFQPWWFIRTMIVEKLDLLDWEHKRQHYLSKGTWNAYLRVLQLESYAFLIFLVGNIGIRVIGFLEILRRIFIKKYWINNNPFEVCIFVMMAVAFIIPLLFLQKGIASNTIQFMQYFLLFFGLYGAIASAKIVEKIKGRVFKIIFILLIVSLSVPTVIGNLVEFYGPGKTPLAKVSNQELEALQFLKNNSEKDSVILSPSFNKYLKDEYLSEPFPIYAWSSTGYVSGLTGRRTYLALEDMVIQTGLDYEGRLKKVNNFFENPNDQKFLRNEQINFLYIPKAHLKNPINSDFLKTVFENDEVLIYKVN